MPDDAPRRDGPTDPARWRSHPRLAVALRSAIVLSPVVVSIGAGLLVARLLGDRPVWQFVLLVGSVCLATSLLVERVVRRFLPLEALLRMTMLFPERAPSRLAVARLGRDRAEQRRLLASQPGADDVAHVMLALITALGHHDKRTRGHSERVRMITELLADQLALPQADRDRLLWAALLHDVGKLDVPASVISKPAKLDAAEWDLMRQHPAHGARLAGAFTDWLGEWAGGILHHHERWDGGGYPAGLAGEQISRAGRIVGVVDAFETMTAARSYKKAGGTRAALTELARCAGTQFDPAVVRLFLCIPVPRLWWATGPLGLLVQVPVIGSAQQSALQVTAAVTTSAGSTVAAAGTAAVVGVGSALGVAAPSALPASAGVVQEGSDEDRSPAASAGGALDGSPLTASVPGSPWFGPGAPGAPAAPGRAPGLDGGPATPTAGPADLPTGPGAPTDAPPPGPGPMDAPGGPGGPTGAPGGGPTGAGPTAPPDPSTPTARPTAPPPPAAPAPRPPTTTAAPAPLVPVPLPTALPPLPTALPPLPVPKTSPPRGTVPPVPGPRTPDGPTVPVLPTVVPPAAGGGGSSAGGAAPALPGGAQLPGLPAGQGAAPGTG